jgi:hypothetical protein
VALPQLGAGDTFTRRGPARGDSQDASPVLPSTSRSQFALGLSRAGPVTHAALLASAVGSVGAPSARSGKTRITSWRCCWLIIFVVPGLIAASDLSPDVQAATDSYDALIASLAIPITVDHQEGQGQVAPNSGQHIRKTVHGHATSRIKVFTLRGEPSTGRPFAIYTGQAAGL